MAKTLYIDQLLARKPAKLSGGERQRVALGRAIVRRPRAMLMDEPLANLDALLRLEMRVELKRMQQELGTTLVYVTHDQVEAMSMADRIAVLHHGRLQQCTTPDEIYNLPANRFVATVVGSPPTNFIPSELMQRNDDLLIVHPAFAMRAAGNGHSLYQALESRQSLGRQVLVGMRPEDVQLFAAAPGPESVPAHVSVIEPLGSEIIVDLMIGPNLVKAIVPPSQRLGEGQNVWAMFNMQKVHVFDPDSGARLFSTCDDARLDCLGRQPES